MWIAALSVFAPLARAGDVTQAEALFREGRTLARAGDWAHACPKFAESQRLDPAPGTLLNLADCEEHFGSVVKAREHFALAASGFPANVKGHAEALARANALEGKVAHLRIKLASDLPPTVTVRYDNVIVDPATVGRSMEADPGTHEVVLSLTEHPEQRYTVTLSAGESRELTLDLGAAVPAEVRARVAAGPPPPEAPARRDGTRTALAATFLGVGGVSLVVGTVTGIVTLDDASTVRRECILNGRTCPTQQGVAAAAQGSSMSIASTVTLIAGAALAGVGAYFLFVPSKATYGAALVPFVSPGSAGLTVSRSF
jgi:hypothetical protein